MSSPTTSLYSFNLKSQDDFENNLFFLLSGPGDTRGGQPAFGVACDRFRELNGENQTTVIGWLVPIVRKMLEDPSCNWRKSSEYEPAQGLLLFAREILMPPRQDSSKVELSCPQEVLESARSQMVTMFLSALGCEDGQFSNPTMASVSNLGCMLVGTINGVFMDWESPGQTIDFWSKLIEHLSVIDKNSIHNPIAGALSICNSTEDLGHILAALPWRDPEFDTDRFASDLAFYPKIERKDLVTYLRSFFDNIELSQVGTAIIEKTEQFLARFDTRKS